MGGVLTHHERYDGSGYPLGLKAKKYRFLGELSVFVTPLMLLQQIALTKNQYLLLELLKC